MPHDDWGENTTVLTGVTNDSHTCDEQKRVNDSPIGRVVSRRCSRVLWLTAAGLNSLIAVFSASVMCALPVLVGYIGYEYPPVSCEVDCQGYTLVAIKTGRGSLGSLLEKSRWRPTLTLFPRAALTLFGLFILCVFSLLHRTDTTRTP